MKNIIVKERKQKQQKETNNATEEVKRRMNKGTLMNKFIILRNYFKVYYSSKTRNRKDYNSAMIYTTLWRQRWYRKETVTQRKVRKTKREKLKKVIKKSRELIRLKNAKDKKRKNQKNLLKGENKRAGLLKL